MAWDRTIPWRQGSVLQKKDLKLFKIDLHDGSDSVFVVVISHDCDLVQVLENEPSVEVIVGIGISKSDGNFTYGKNPRRLHLEFSDGEEKVWVELLNTQKTSIPKASSKAVGLSVSLMSFNLSEGEDFKIRGTD